MVYVSSQIYLTYTVHSLHMVSDRDETTFERESEPEGKYFYVKNGLGSSGRISVEKTLIDLYTTCDTFTSEYRRHEVKTRSKVRGHSDSEAEDEENDMKVEFRKCHRMFSLEL